MSYFTEMDNIDIDSEIIFEFADSRHATTPSVCEKHITDQNTQLLKDNRTLRADNRNLVALLDEMTVKLHRMRRQIANHEKLCSRMRELYDEYEELNNTQHSLIRNITCDIDYYRSKAYSHLRVFYAILISFALYNFSWYPLAESIPVVVCMMVVAAFSESMFLNIPDISFEHKRKQITCLEADIEARATSTETIRKFLGKDEKD